MENPQRPQCHVQAFNFLDIDIAVPQQGHGGRDLILGKLPPKTETARPPRGPSHFSVDNTRPTTQTDSSSVAKDPRGESFPDCGAPQVPSGRAWQRPGWPARYAWCSSLPTDSLVCGW